MSGTRWTMEQLKAYDARREVRASAERQARQANAGATPVEHESDLHAQIIQECARRGWLPFHGSMAHKTFRTPGEPDFVILASPREGRCPVCDYRTTPDRIGETCLGALCQHDGVAIIAVPRILLVECKTKDGKLSLDQQAVHAWARRLGHTVHTIRSLEDFMKIA